MNIALHPFSVKSEKIPELCVTQVWGFLRNFAVINQNIIVYEENSLDDGSRGADGGLLK